MEAQRYTKETILKIGMSDRNFPEFNAGDCVRVSQKVVEGDKERIQHFEGDIIAVRHHGIATTITVRRIGAHSVAVERVFPIYSPTVTAIQFVRSGDVRRAKLFYMRDRIGREARVAEKKASRQEGAAEETKVTAAE